MARESEEGEVLVAPGAEIALTMPLLIQKNPWDTRYHCERRPASGSRAASVGWG